MPSKSPPNLTANVSREARAVPCTASLCWSKDNIDTAGLHTTAGSLALMDGPAPKDAFLVTRLRAAGAVLLGKTNLSEWANFRGQHSPSGWSGRGGQTKNPYALDHQSLRLELRIRRAGTAAGLCARGGRNGNRWIRSSRRPRSTALSASSRPLELVSRSGIIPISASQDTAGPMARTVRDAVLLLNAPHASPDPGTPKTPVDYSQFLDPGGLKGASLGIVRKSFGFNADVNNLMDQSIAAMKSHGAEIIDPVEIPPDAKIGDPEMEVLLYELKAGLNAYMKAQGPHRNACQPHWFQ